MTARATAIMTDTELANYLSALAPSRLEALAAELAADTDTDADAYAPRQQATETEPTEATYAYALAYPI